MDGNACGAANGFACIAGFHHGAEALWKIVRSALAAGVTHLTLVGTAFDGLAGGGTETRFLLRVLRNEIDRHLSEIQSEGIRLAVLGDRRAWASGIVASIEQAEQRTRHNGRMQLTVALNYRGRSEITDATRRLAILVRQGALRPEEISEEIFAETLGTGFLPELDLMIRTSGEQRVSDLLLWQSAYAEMLFIEKRWQDFASEDLTAALVEFSRRERRFGAAG